jgi:hypothetical protein
MSFRIVSWVAPPTPIGVSNEQFDRGTVHAGHKVFIVSYLMDGRMPRIPQNATAYAGFTGLPSAANRRAVKQE